MKNTDNDIGKLIRKKRKEKNLSQEKLAEFVGVGKGTVSKWERGAIKNMGVDKGRNLSLALGIDPLIFSYGIKTNTEIKSITPEEFRNEVFNLLSKCTGLSEQEKQMIISTTDFICLKKRE